MVSHGRLCVGSRVTTVKQGELPTGTLATMLGICEAAVRRLANPEHPSHLGSIEGALRVLGSSLRVEVTAA